MTTIIIDPTKTPENADHRGRRLQGDEHQDFLNRFTDIREDWRAKTITQSLFVVHKDLPPGDYMSHHRTYLDYLVECWAKHHGAVLTPDILWFELMCEVGAMVKETPDKFRSLFTEIPEGKGEIVIQTGELIVMPLDLLADRLKDVVPMNTDVFLPRFTTTTDKSRLALYAAFADMASPYYNYSMLLCGIPKIVLMGTEEDWRIALLNWREIMRTMGSDDPWFGKVEIILTAIHGGFSHPESLEGFWRGMFNAKFCGSGGDIELEGWITQLFRKPRPRPAYPSNFGPHIAKVEYKNLSTGKEYVMTHGIFTSYWNPIENVQTPTFGSVIVEKRAVESRSTEQPKTERLTLNQPVS